MLHTKLIVPAFTELKMPTFIRKVRIIRGAPDQDPDPARGSGKIRIRPDPNSLDPVNRIHYHVVVPITVSMQCVLSPSVQQKQVTNCTSNASSVHVSYILL